jgi:cyclopropane fatty-acyl-phospholipid synthase-like methyltransferase
VSFFAGKATLLETATRLVSGGMESYSAFAVFYDAVQGDRAEQVAYLRSLIEKHHPAARSVLELACGTGAVLKHLAADYEVTGVDLSEAMLAVAREKVAGARLVREDMTRIDLAETFDVVLCVYDSMNHLLGFEQWELAFERTREHLSDGGIFVFDINTQQQLATFIEQPPWTHWFGDGHLLIMDVTDGGNGVSIWSIRVFERRGDSCYRLHSEDIREVSFPVEKIKSSLRERYQRVWIYDALRVRPTSRSERLHFVCRG